MKAEYMSTTISIRHLDYSYDSSINLMTQPTPFYPHINKMANNVFKTLHAIVCWANFKQNFKSH